GVESIDAVLYTHAHADHIHGIDDIRGFVLQNHRQVPIWADVETMDRIREGLGYCLRTPPGSVHTPVVPQNHIDPMDAPVIIEGAGGAITFQPLLQVHGSIHSLGFRIGNVAYCSDISDFPDETLPHLAGLDMLVIDALQYRFHSSHLSIGQALEWIERLK